MAFYSKQMGWQSPVIKSIVADPQVRAALLSKAEALDGVFNVPELSFAVERLASVRMKAPKARTAVPKGDIVLQSAPTAANSALSADMVQKLVEEALERQFGAHGQHHSNAPTVDQTVSAAINQLSGDIDIVKRDVSGLLTATKAGQEQLQSRWSSLETLAKDQRSRVEDTAEAVGGLVHRQAEFQGAISGVAAQQAQLSTATSELRQDLGQVRAQVQAQAAALDRAQQDSASRAQADAKARAGLEAAIRAGADAASSAAKAAQEAAQQVKAAVARATAHAASAQPNAAPQATRAGAGAGAAAQAVAAGAGKGVSMLDMIGSADDADDPLAGAGRAVAMNAGQGGPQGAVQAGPGLGAGPMGYDVVDEFDMAMAMPPGQRSVVGGGAAALNASQLLSVDSDLGSGPAGAAEAQPGAGAGKPEGAAGPVAKTPGAKRVRLDVPEEHGKGGGAAALPSARVTSSSRRKARVIDDSQDASQAQQAPQAGAGDMDDGGLGLGLPFSLGLGVLADLTPPGPVQGGAKSALGALAPAVSLAEMERRDRRRKSGGEAGQGSQGFSFEQQKDRDGDVAMQGQDGAQAQAQPQHAQDVDYGGAEYQYGQAQEQQGVDMEVEQQAVAKQANVAAAVPAASDAKGRADSTTKAGPAAKAAGAARGKAAPTAAAAAVAVQEEPKPAAKPATAAAPAAQGRAHSAGKGNDKPAAAAPVPKPLPGHGPVHMSLNSGMSWTANGGDDSQPVVPGYGGQGTSWASRRTVAIADRGWMAATERDGQRPSRPKSEATGKGKAKGAAAGATGDGAQAGRYGTSATKTVAKSTSTGKKLVPQERALDSQSQAPMGGSHGHEEENAGEHGSQAAAMADPVAAEAAAIAAMRARAPKAGLLASLVKAQSDRKIGSGAGAGAAQGIGRAQSASAAAPGRAGLSTVNRPAANRLPALNQVRRNLMSIGGGDEDADMGQAKGKGKGYDVTRDSQFAQSEDSQPRQAVQAAAAQGRAQATSGGRLTARRRVQELSSPSLPPPTEESVRRAALEAPPGSVIEDTQDEEEEELDGQDQGTADDIEESQSQRGAGRVDKQAGAGHAPTKQPAKPTVDPNVSLFGGRSAAMFNAFKGQARAPGPAKAAPLPINKAGRAALGPAFNNVTTTVAVARVPATTMAKPAAGGRPASAGPVVGKQAAAAGRGPKPSAAAMALMPPPPLPPARRIGFQAGAAQPQQAKPPAPPAIVAFGQAGPLAARSWAGDDDDDMGGAGSKQAVGAQAGRTSAGPNKAAVSAIPASKSAMASATSRPALAIHVTQDTSLGLSADHGDGAMVSSMENISPDRIGVGIGGGSPGHDGHSGAVGSSASQPSQAVRWSGSAAAKASAKDMGPAASGNTTANRRPAVVLDDRNVVRTRVATGTSGVEGWGGGGTAFGTVSQYGQVAMGTTTDFPGLEDEDEDGEGAGGYGQGAAGYGQRPGAGAEQRSTGRQGQASTGHGSSTGGGYEAQEGQDVFSEELPLSQENRDVDGEDEDDVDMDDGQGQGGQDRASTSGRSSAHSGGASSHGKASTAKSAVFDAYSAGTALSGTSGASSHSHKSGHAYAPEVLPDPLAGWAGAGMGMAVGFTVRPDGAAASSGRRSAVNQATGARSALRPGPVSSTAGHAAQAGAAASSRSRAGGASAAAGRASAAGRNMLALLADDDE